MGKISAIVVSTVLSFTVEAMKFPCQLKINNVTYILKNSGIAEARLKENEHSLHKMPIRRKIQKGGTEFIVTTITDSNVDGARKIFFPKEVETVEGNIKFRCRNLQEAAFESDSLLKKIGNYAFMGADELLICVPKNTESIGMFAFSSCGQLELSFESPSRLRQIENSCFSCSLLKSIIIPSAVENIGSSCFALCTELKEFIFEQNFQLRSIGKGAFWNADPESVFIPACIESIGDFCFCNCTNLKKITFEANSKIKEIGCNAFERTEITHINLPPSVEILCDNCFAHCNQLKKVIFFGNSRLRIIEPSAFKETSLRFLIIPYCANIEFAAITSPLGPFSKIVTTEKGNKYRLLGGSALCLRGKGPEIETVIIHENKQYNVITLENFTSATERIIIPASISNIGARCFKDCKNLNRIEFAEGSRLLRIGDGAFANTGLKSITLPPTEIKFRGNKCFSDCSEFRSFNGKYTLELSDDGILETNCSAVLESWFSGVLTLKSIHIPSSVKSIEKDCFYGCKNLQEVIFAHPFKLRYIGSRAFGKTGIVSIRIPSEVKYIGSKCFTKCENLTAVTVEGNLKALDNNKGYFFKHCPKLETITLDAHQFILDPKKKTFEIPKDIKALKYQWFAKMSVLQSIIIHNDLEKIGEECFLKCPDLQTIQLHMDSGLKDIGPDAFDKCAKLQGAIICVTPYFSFDNSQYANKVTRLILMLQNELPNGHNQISLRYPFPTPAAANDARNTGQS
ncbi:MAG: leucine-rich repeat domain-containing protein [Holosporaceae bacterium]|jgi:hypothetical protein|nr:leucine-rich repeat domain-containing protein [Holosporaceae bacterium]